MKLRITHLKAPWPAGAVVGDVLDLPAVPAWAVGKCEPAPDDAEITILSAEQLARMEREAAEKAEADAKAVEQSAPAKKGK